MIIIGCDYHPAFQQIAFVNTDTGELQERRLQHREEAEKFYRDLAAQGMKVREGMEASGHARWFERLLAELNFELWIGDAAEILELCAEGMTLKEVAAEMGRDEGSVKNYSHRLQEKLEAKTLAHAVALGFRGQFVR